MIELIALIPGDSDPAQLEGRIARLQAAPLLSRSPHRREARAGRAYMLVAGGRPVDGCFFSDASLTLICNADLSESLTGGPAPAIARLYQKNGDGFARQLRGSFGIILYDHRTRELKSWTDHFGVRRIVYGEAGGTFAIASDIRLLTAVRDSAPDIDPASVLQYLQYTVIPGPRTIYAGIHRLDSGQQLKYGRGVALDTYWDMTYPEEGRWKRSEQEWAGRVEESIRFAVARHIPGGPPNVHGCFLSGGTDSSSVTGLVGQLTGGPPRSYSIGFDDPRYNEISYARIAAEAFKSDHHEYFVTPKDILELLPVAADAYDEPFGNSSLIPSYYCARMACGDGVTHMLAGDGGDELFGGNSRYASDRVFQSYHRIPAAVRKGLVEPVLSLPGPWQRLTVFGKANRYVRRANIALPDRLFSYSLLSTLSADLLLPDFVETVRDADPLEPARGHFRRAQATDDLNRWLYLDLKITITDNDLRKVTAMSELAGVTPRYPLLDPDLAEFSGTIPSSLKVKGTRLRYIFKKAMANLLPEAIIQKSKHGFGLPYSVWLGEYKPLRDFTFDILGTAQCNGRGYFRRDFLEHLWNRYQTVDRVYYGDVIWIFLMLELWHSRQHDRRQAYVGGAAGA